MDKFTANDYKVLASVISDGSKGKSKITGLTKAELSQKSGLSYSKVRSAIILLEKNGFIAYGLSKGKADTVYITEKGINELKSISDSANLIKGGNING